MWLKIGENVGLGVLSRPVLPWALATALLVFVQLSVDFLKK
jgi:hypothetical protein